MGLISSRILWVSASSLALILNGFFLKKSLELIQLFEEKENCGNYIKPIFILKLYDLQNIKTIITQFLAILEIKFCQDY